MADGQVNTCSSGHKFVKAPPTLLQQRSKTPRLLETQDNHKPHNVVWSQCPTADREDEYFCSCFVSLNGCFAFV